MLIVRVTAMSARSSEPSVQTMWTPVTMLNHKGTCGASNNPCNLTQGGIVASSAACECKDQQAHYGYGLHAKPLQNLKRGVASTTGTLIALAEAFLRCLKLCVLRLVCRPAESGEVIATSVHRTLAESHLAR
eukprot:3050245-Amphidinium_carterae.2